MEKKLRHFENWLVVYNYFPIVSKVKLWVLGPQCDCCSWWCWIKWKKMRGSKNCIPFHQREKTRLWNLDVDVVQVKVNVGTPCSLRDKVMLVESFKVYSLYGSNTAKVAQAGLRWNKVPVTCSGVWTWYYINALLNYGQWSPQWLWYSF